MWGLQSPNEVLDWRNDWTDWLGEGVTIQSSTWSITPSATLDNDMLDTSGNVTIVVVSGLELGKSYQLRNTIVTSDDITSERDITIRCGTR